MKTPKQPHTVTPIPLSWNEIRSRALAFSKEWANETSEDAEAKAFWDSFLATNAGHCRVLPSQLSQGENCEQFT